MASLLSRLTGGVETTGSVLDTMQDVIDTVANFGHETVANPTIAAPAQAAPVVAASGGSSDNMLLVVVVVVLAVVLLR